MQTFQLDRDQMKEFSRMRRSMESIQRLMNDKRTITWYAYTDILKTKLVEKSYLIFCQYDDNPDHKYITTSIWHPVLGFDKVSSEDDIIAVAFIDNIKFPDTRDLVRMSGDI